MIFSCRSFKIFSFLAQTCHFPRRADRASIASACQRAHESPLTPRKRLKTEQPGCSAVGYPSQVGQVGSRVAWWVLEAVLRAGSSSRGPRTGDVGPGRISGRVASERSWVVHCRGAEINGSLIARRGRVVALIEVSSANVKVRDGGLHVLRVGDERSCNAFLLPRASGQSRCDRLIFMLLREGHALNCRRPLRAERMVESKWFSRSF